jgi:hypothetical protein
VIFRNDNGTDYCQFEHLADCRDIRHAVFLRTSGCSAKPFDRLNVSLSVGDEVQRVQRNRQRMATALGAGELVFMRQVHGHSVRVIDDRPAAAGMASPEADALITDRPGKFLVVQVADCQPILMYDPVRRVVANVHCGWRGSVAGIVARSLEALITSFGSAARDILVGIGPSLGPCCAEFVNYRGEIPRALWGYRRNAVYFDFWEMSRDQLTAAGVREDHIEISRLCTRCHSDRFFSYRAEKRTGRLPAVIGLKKA